MAAKVDGCQPRTFSPGKRLSNPRESPSVKIEGFKPCVCVWLNAEGISSPHERRSETASNLHRRFGPLLMSRITGYLVDIP
jgi:hypothetical protein